MEEIVFQNDIIRSVVSTTQAVDLIGGGVKSNALPELRWATHYWSAYLNWLFSSWAIINTRIATDSSVSAVKEHYTNLLRDYAINTNITLTSFGQRILDRGKVKKIEVSDAWGTALEPAPISPLDGEAWKLLSGTILATEQASEDIPVFVMPFISTGACRYTLRAGSYLV